jgi:hypothetical protein
MALRLVHYDPVVHVDGLRQCLWTAVTNGPICSPPRWYVSMGSLGGMILTGENGIIRRKAYLSATLSTTNPTWTDLGANPGFRSKRPATIRDHTTLPATNVRRLSVTNIQPETSQRGTCSSPRKCDRICNEPVLTASVRTPQTPTSNMNDSPLLLSATLPCRLHSVARGNFWDSDFIQTIWRHFLPHSNSPFTSTLLFDAIRSKALIVQDGHLASLFGVSWSHSYRHGRTPLYEWSARRRDLYLHRTTQHIDTTNIHVPSGIRTCDPSNQAAADRAATGIGIWCYTT